MKKNGFLDSIRVASPCTQDWEEMRGGEKARLCEHCALEVNNLSALSRKEALRLVRQSEGGICVRYVRNPETNAPVFAEKLYQITRRAGIAAGVLGASLTLSTLVYAQGGITGATNKQAETVTENPSKKDKTESNAGTLSGIVTDPNGAVISGTVVTLSNENTSETQIATVANNGSYEFKNLVAGTYKLKAEAGTAFTEIEISGIEISAESRLKQDISLSATEALVVEVTTGTLEETMVTMGTVAVVRFQEPLLGAISGEDFEEVKDLIAKGANVNAKDKNYGETTALHVAVDNGNQEIAKYLLDMGAKINARDKQRRTPLMSIDYDATPELARMLLDHRAKVNAFDTEGNTALIYAAEYENAEILRVLLDADASVNTQNKEGKTALMTAAENGYHDNVKVLLEAGADVNLRDESGKTALDLSDDERIKELLKSYNAKEN